MKIGYNVLTKLFYELICSYPKVQTFRDLEEEIIPLACCHGEMMVGLPASNTGNLFNIFDSRILLYTVNFVFVSLPP